jgi:hypothetical protein
MFLCIWTAVHLNLPEHKKEHEQRMRKVGWLVLGLLAPEVVAWNAFEQRRDVKRLTQDMRKLYLQQHGMEEDVKKKPWYHTMASWWRTARRAQWLKRGWHKTKVFFLCEAEELPLPPNGDWPTSTDKDAAEAYWTDLHSWYVIMGGIAFDTSSASKPFLPESRERIVLTAEGILKLAEYWPDLLPRLSQGDIEDKSKSDGLAKLITCWQATWFCVQCICRLTQGFSISLLELNVFGHAICALLIYMLWWTKPKDISEPTKIVGNNSHSVAAWMCNLSTIGRPLLYDQRWRRISQIDGPFTYYLAITFIPYLVHDGQETRPLCHWYSPEVVHYPIWYLKAPYCLHIAGTDWRVETRGDREIDSDSTYVTVDTLTANRLSLIRQLSKTPNYTESIHSNGDFVRYRSRNWRVNFDIIDDNLLPWEYIGGITLACGLYGGLHATAWLVRKLMDKTVTQTTWSPRAVLH